MIYKIESIRRVDSATGIRTEALRLALLLFYLSVSARALGASLADNFANRELLTASTGQMIGSNVGGTLETGEPQYGGKPGGRSVWISWQAPGDGLATFFTDGTGFDTLLAAYYFGQPTDTTLDKLKEASRNDDDPTRFPTRTSLIQFGAQAGTRYEIQVDGYRGLSGEIHLKWDFIPAKSPPPIIVSLPADRAARQGDTVTLSVDMQTSPDLRLQWRLNGQSINEKGTTLVIASLQPANVGRYTLRMDLDSVRFETEPIELQINSEGQTNALARDKLFEAIQSPLLPDDKGGRGSDAAGQNRLHATARLLSAGAGVGVSRGYNGTQIFSTTFATPDPNEPDHCGQVGGATYWYGYQPPADGTLMLDTLGSTYDTVLAVYTYNPPFNSYADLIPIACASGSPGSRGSTQLELAAPKSRQYLVVVDGINGARGIVHLNYRLDTNRPPIPPTLVQTPVSRVAPPGATVLLQPDIKGSPPLHFFWRKGTDLLSGSTNSFLQLNNVLPAYSGNYVVTVSSHVGSPLEVLMSLRVVAPLPRLDMLGWDGKSILSFQSLSSQRYWLEYTAALGEAWARLTASFSGDDSIIVITNSPVDGRQFYRLRVE